MIRSHSKFRVKLKFLVYKKGSKNAKKTLVSIKFGNPKLSWSVGVRGLVKPSFEKNGGRAKCLWYNFCRGSRVRHFDNSFGINDIHFLLHILKNIIKKCDISPQVVTSYFRCPKWFHVRIRKSTFWKKRPGNYKIIRSASMLNCSQSVSKCCQ